jgi:predicted choloylglycine hydrolase
MDRRGFVKLAATSPFLIPSLVVEARQQRVSLTGGTSNAFPLLEVRGSYHEIGYQIGKHFRTSIHTVIARRQAWFDRLIQKLDTVSGRHRAGELLRLTRIHFPQYLSEVQGMAEGAGISFAAMWALTIKSELAAATEPEPPGCSTLFFNGDSRSWLGHNEDGSVAYHDLMFMVRVQPPSGISFVSMVYPGTLTGNGPSMNSRGIVQTTNYIGSTRSEIGVPRYVLGRAILEAGDLREAEQIATFSPRAYPYHHNLACVCLHRYLSVETTPEKAQTESPDGLYIHTNHLRHEQTSDYLHEDQAYRSSSSLSRYRVLTGLAQGLDLAGMTPATMLQMLSSHDSAPYSPCRHPQGDVKGQTLGTASVDLHRGELCLYRGQPCIAVPSRSSAVYII